MTDTSPEPLRKVNLLGTLPLAHFLLESSPAHREALREAHREADHFERARALGVSQDDARTILDREREPAIERARTTAQPLDRDNLWRRIHDELVRHSMGEPYDPHREWNDYLRRIGATLDGDTRPS